MRIYYDLAIDSRVRILKLEQFDGPPVDDALGNFRLARRFERYIEGERKLQFLVATYGLALTLHTISENAKDDDDCDYSTRQERALQEFKRFLEKIAKLNGRGKYLFTYHILQAECYIQSPSQACFDKNLCLIEISYFDLRISDYDKCVVVLI